MSSSISKGSCLTCLMRKPYGMSNTVTQGSPTLKPPPTAEADCATGPTGKPERSDRNGEWSAWSARWPAIGAGADRCLYTTGKPKTPGQQYLRAYWSMLQPLVKGGWRCVELGSGRGTLSMYLAAAGHDVTLVDLAQTGLDIARGNWRKAGLPPFQAVAADVRDTGLTAASFELVHSVGLLEHFADPAPVLAESKRLLAKGGLTWHIIVGGHGGRSTVGMFRNELTAADYARIAQSVGLAASCSPTVFAHVLRLKAWLP